MWLCLQAMFVSSSFSNKTNICYNGNTSNSSHHFMRNCLSIGLEPGFLETTSFNIWGWMVSMNVYGASLTLTQIILFTTTFAPDMVNPWIKIWSGFRNALVHLSFQIWLYNTCKQHHLKTHHTQTDHVGISIIQSVSPNGYTLMLRYGWLIWNF